METETRTPTVELRETDLFEVYCHLLESGEIEQYYGAMFGPTQHSACVLGVAHITLRRAGFNTPGAHSTSFYDFLHPRFGEICDRAGALLGYHGIAAANDCHESFTLLAPALRRARLDVEAMPAPEFDLRPGGAHALWGNAAVAAPASWSFPIPPAPTVRLGDEWSKITDEEMRREIDAIKAWLEVSAREYEKPLVFR